MDSWKGVNAVPSVAPSLSYTQGQNLPGTDRHEIAALIGYHNSEAGVPL
jgi:hypothetical protein